MAENSEMAGEIGERVVAIARRWIGTPYLHQASCEAAGADCLGLVRGIWREIYGAEPESAGAYTADWSETDGRERLAESARRYFQEVPAGDEKTGDLLLFRMKSGSAAKHLAIIENWTPGHEAIIHAYSGHGVVCSPLGPALVRRIACRFRFPDRRH